MREKSSADYEDFFISNSKNSLRYYSLSPKELFYFSSLYYSISSAGLFYLFKTNLAKVDKQLILKNKDDWIFKSLLYPYLDLKTLEKIQSKRLLGKIFSYFNKCCDIIHGNLTILNGIEERGGEEYFLAVTGALTDPEYENDGYGSKQFIEYLKNKFNIEWLDVNNTKIIEVDKNRLFKICDEKNSKNDELLFELYPERGIAILSERNYKILDWFNIEGCSGDFNIRHFNPFMVEDYIDAEFDAKNKYCILNNIDTFAHELCHSILEYLFGGSLNPLTEEEKINRRQECIAFAKDKKFQAIAHDINREVDSSFENLTRYSKE